MPLAHIAAPGGPNTEILLLGVGMLVLAAVFFFQKTASRTASLVLLALGAAAVTGAFTVARTSADEHQDASVTIESPADGATVAANEPVPVEVTLEGAELASETTDESGGHLHVLVDGETLEMIPTLDVEVELEPGDHEVTVEYVGADHQPLDPPVADSVTVSAE